jgi:hypothetical protein
MVKEQVLGRQVSMKEVVVMQVLHVQCCAEEEIIKEKYLGFFLQEN